MKVINQHVRKAKSHTLARRKEQPLDGFGGLQLIFSNSIIILYCVLCVRALMLSVAMKKGVILQILNIVFRLSLNWLPL